MDSINIEFSKKRVLNVQAILDGCVRMQMRWLVAWVFLPPPIVRIADGTHIRSAPANVSVKAAAGSDYDNQRGLMCQAGRLIFQRISAWWIGKGSTS